MPAIEVVDHHVLYENPIPEIRSRHSYFPGVVKLPSGDLLALFALGEAMDAANVTTVASRSRDQGRTWGFEGPIHEKSPDCRFDSDYLKPTVLRDGTLMATGYRFHRTDPDSPLANPETGGLRDGQNLVSFSHDEGRQWSTPKVIPRTRPELVEASGPCIELRSGTILAAGELFPMWDGGNPSSYAGGLLRSDDKGKTWDDSTLFFADALGTFRPAEPRLCEMEDGRVIILFWTVDHVGGTSLPNHYVVSRDQGKTWSKPIDTGIPAQAPNLMFMGGDRLLTIHSHREGETGLYVRIVDLLGDRWQAVEEAKIWGNAPSSKVASFTEMAKQLRFGQPSLLALDTGDILATHWAIEDGQGRILTHRLRVAH